MTKFNEIHKCEICGNIVEVLQEGAGSLVCCGKSMTLKNESTNDGALEKHLPVIEKKDDGIIIKVGEVAHPMIKEHHIQWIEVFTKSETIRINLNSDDRPEAYLNIKLEDVVFVREYCNLHGLWKTIL
ncbi:desulfoferrodoxin [Clostridium carnis]